MHLLIDAGNTRIKWCLFDANQQPPLDCQYSNRQVFIESVAQSSCSSIESIWLSAVRNSDQLIRQLKEQFQVPLHSVSSKGKYKELTSGYTKPEQLGVDRWLALCSGYERYHDSFIVIDAGTAITLDVVDKDSCHLGGHIIPGRDLMVESLNMNTHLIEVKGIATSYELSLGVDTNSAVTNGASTAVTAYISSVIDHYPGYKVAVTGGAAEEINASLPRETEVVENLVLEGLSLMI